MKVFSISNRNSENSELFLIGKFTTIIVLGAVGSLRFDTLLSNNYPKECQKRSLMSKMKVGN
jgi:hypothetical protein